MERRPDLARIYQIWRGGTTEVAEMATGENDGGRKKKRGSQRLQPPTAQNAGTLALAEGSSTNELVR